MPISIYPPTLQSTQPAFSCTKAKESYSIYFKLQPVTAYEDIGHVQIRIVRQTNNRSIVNTSLYPDGTIYKKPSEIWHDEHGYSVIIYRRELAESWQPGCLYKVQMRFGTTEKFVDIGTFAAWKQEQIDRQTFSEWSTVMVIKALEEPEVEIQNAQRNKDTQITQEQRVEASLTPLFVGSYYSIAANKEMLDKYWFNLYYKDELIETSGEKQHDGSSSAPIEHRFKTVLQNDEIYEVRYGIRTVNGFEKEAKPYLFQAIRVYYADLEGITMRVENDTVYCKENGCINIYLNSTIPVSGSCVIVRSCEDTDYQIWEDLHYENYSNLIFEEKLIYQDFTIESGIKYKYAFQMENKAGLRTSPIYPTSDAPKSINLEYSYLYRDGIQLKLQFNQQISSFKHTTLVSKQDTLGSKFPHLARNGNAYYAEFPISGLISFQMDSDKTFMTLGEKGFMHNGDLVISRDKFIQRSMVRQPCEIYSDTTDSLGTVTNDKDLVIDTSLSDNNIFVERKFREIVEEFLNDFNAKLYRSPTEGNIVIGLMNVSLTPNQTLGRMIYNFSATAYEIMDNTLEGLDKAGVINIGQFESLANEERFRSFGQIKGVYTPFPPHNSPVDVYAMIKEQEEISIGGGYKMQLENLVAFWIERYPAEDFKEDLMELEAQKAALETKGEDTAEIEAKIAAHLALQQALDGPPATASMIVDGREVMVFPHRIYSLREPVKNLIIETATQPLIINYVCETTQQEDQTVGVVSAIDSSRIWGQVSGVFTGTDEVLKTYRYEYGPGELPFRVYNGNPDALVIYDKFGNVLVDNTNFNVYKTINLYEVVKEDAKYSVEIIYDIATGFYLDETGRWTDGSLYYEFIDITEFDIEIEPNSIIYIGSKPDGSDATEIRVGPTGRYVLKPIDNLIRYIALKDSSYAIINYKCLTRQMRMDRR